MTVNEAIAIAGTLSNPSKMPCHGYSIPAAHCKVGARLRKVAGSTCSKCYALKGRYIFPNVQNALENRFESLEHPLWIDAMVAMISSKKNGYFRWHDSGDLQSVQHLHNICVVAALTPDVKHWIPTREYKIVEDYRKSGGVIPTNLVIRLSAHMVNAAAPEYGLPTSTVHAEQDGPFKVLNAIPTGSHKCPARDQGNKCGDCRACWNAEIKNISYHIH